MAPGRYRFGEFELDVPRLELRHRGATVPLQPKALDLLIHLVRHHERVVTKDELFEALWPDTVVTEASLSKAVSAARRALARDASAECIATVRGRGFRFTAPVRSEEAGTPASGEAAGGVARAAATWRGRGTAESDGAFVGRAEVLSAIDDALEVSARGMGRLLLVTGEAGMGKTRIAQEAASRGLAAGVRVLEGWCHEADGAPDLWPWLAVLRQALEHPGATGLTRGLGAGIAELADLLPALRDHLTERLEPARLEPENARFRRLETLAEILLRAARSEPHLVVLDDFHRADPDSLSLLRFLVRALAGARLTLVVTHRSEELPVGHPLLDLARGPRCHALPLAGLTGAEVETLVQAEAGRRVPSRVVQAIHDRSDGNPFFVKELVRGLAATGRLDLPDDAGMEPLPAGIRNVLHERLGRLSPDCRELLVLAALLGAELDVPLLAQARGCAAEEVLALLDEACASRVVRPTEAGFRFSHALLREELVGPVPAAERARLHRTIGEALEAHHRSELEPHLGRLSYHFCAGAAAGGARQGVRYARLAGDRARRLHNHREAAEHYRRALLAGQLVGAPDDRELCELQLALGEACVASGEPREGRATLERAAQVARRTGDAERFARAALAAGGLELSSQVGVDDPALVTLLEDALEALPADQAELGVRLRTRLGEALYWSAEWDRSAAAIERAVAEGRRLGDPVALGYALNGKHWLEFVGPGPGASLEAAEEMVALARRAGSRDLALAAHSCRFLVLLQLGRSGEAKVELARYRDLARELRVPRYRWRAHCYDAALASLEGCLDDVEDAVRSTLAEEDLFLPRDAVGAMMRFFLHREQDRPPETDVSDLATRLPAFGTTWRASIALLLADAGRADEARDALATLVRHDFVEVPRSFTRLSELVLAAEACAAIGDARIAASLRAFLEPYRARMVVIGGGFFCLGSVDRFLGRLAATAGDAEGARRHLEEALAANGRAAAPGWMAWTQLEMARLLGAEADRDGRPYLEEARSTAARLGLARLARAVSDLDKEAAEA